MLLQSQKKGNSRIRKLIMIKFNIHYGLNLYLFIILLMDMRYFWFFRMVRSGVNPKVFRHMS